MCHTVLLYLCNLCPCICVVTMVRTADAIWKVKVMRVDSCRACRFSAEYHLVSDPETGDFNSLPVILLINH